MLNPPIRKKKKRKKIRTVKVVHKFINKGGLSNVKEAQDMDTNEFMKMIEKENR
jgi:hypothetical protein